jgi:polysaccharide biosynthesis protein PslG
MQSLRKSKILCRNYKRHAQRALSFIAPLLLFCCIFGASVQTTFAAQAFPRNLTVGDFGGDVFSLQALLTADGLFTEVKPTGYFGQLTADAVAAWQKSAGLPATGYFGPLTRAEIDFQATPPAPAATAPATTSISTPDSTPAPTSTPAINYDRNLTIGDSGTDVSSLQSDLITQGYLSVASPTGYFGQLTAAALRKWQASSGLPATGYFGMLSRNDMKAIQQSESAAAAPIATPPTVPPLTTSPATSPTSPPTPPVVSDSGGGGGGGGSPPAAAPAAISAPPATANTQQSTPPTIFITSPAPSSTVSKTITVSASASDNVGVIKVEFYVDGSLETTDTSSPYTFSLDTTTLPDGSHNLTAKAYDAAGNIGTAPNITITVHNADTTPPSVSITSPTSNTTVSSTITISASASDNVGVTSVQFTLDGANFGSPDTSAPYKISWNTASSTLGNHSVSAIASDAAGNKKTASTVIVTVVRTVAPATVTTTTSVTTTTTTTTSSSPPPPPPPPTPSTPTNLKATGETTSSISLSWTASTETSGTIAGYRIYRSSIQVGTSTATTFTNTGLAASTTYSYLVRTYDATGAVSASSTVITTSTKSNPPPPPPVATTTATTTLNYNYGISLGETILGLSNSQLNAELNDIASLGIGWIRFDMTWWTAQPNNSSTFSWTTVDQLVSAANAHGIKLLPVLGYLPPWARSSTCPQSEVCEPANPAQFGTFAAAAVQRYAPLGIHDWEIWNEPNTTGFWQPAPNVADYVTLLKAAYTAIKAKDPSATVITGGLAPSDDSDQNISPTDFLTQLYADGGKSYFDAVGMHPYSYPAMPSYFASWNAWQQMFATTPSLESVMAANGDAGKKIWMTEYGAPTNGPGVLETSATDTNFIGSPDHVTEALQAAMLSQAITDVKSYSWAGPLFFYSYKDLGTSTDTVENFFGVVRSDGSDKPAYTTIQDLIGE